MRRASPSSQCMVTPEPSIEYVHESCSVSETSRIIILSAQLQGGKDGTSPWAHQDVNGCSTRRRNLQEKKAPPPETSLSSQKSAFQGETNYTSEYLTQKKGCTRMAELMFCRNSFVGVALSKCLCRNTCCRNTFVGVASE